ncbi:MAG: M20/M25/M40 family metallo-hydrolase [Firmicutes bacterium]|nr:M20/M25/M40 family metallo-hydrolase [Bacillota bacterium]
MNRIHEYIDQNRDRYVQDLIDIVSKPSIGTDPEQTRLCAEAIRDKMKAMGIPAQILETINNPVIYAELPASRENMPTVLFYGHYDVQPARDLDLWDSEPFAPEIRNGRIYGRGVADNKGQFLTQLLAIEAYLKQTGEVPVNVKVILDGEEEIGSKGLADFAAKNKDLLKADLVYTSDGGTQNPEIPTINFGVRGVMNFDLTLETASTDNHSGNKGGVTRNPAWDMVQLLSKMLDENGRVLIPGFYDAVVPMSPKDRELVEALPFRPEQFARDFGVKEIVARDKVDYYDKLMFQPTLTINGMFSGYTGAGCKNIIPKSATAKMEVRFAWKQNPETIYRLIEDFVKERNPQVQMCMVEDYMYPSRNNTELPIYEPVIEAVEKIWGAKAVISPVSGGSLPEFIWTSILEQPSILIPYANPDEANHAPNENLDLSLFQKGIHTTAEVLHALASQK